MESSTQSQTTPPPVSHGVARAAGASVRRSPLLWFIGIGVAFVILALVSVIVILVAYQAGAASKRPQAQGGVVSTVTAPFVAPPPVVPIKVGARKGFGEGYVLNFVNDGERYLKFNVTMRRTTLNQQKTCSLRLEPGNSTELGWAEGFTFVPGDTVIIEHPEYSPRELLVDPNEKTGTRIVKGKL